MGEVRESIPEGEKRRNGSVKHDISVPLSSIQRFLDLAGSQVRSYDEAAPGTIDLYFAELREGFPHALHHLAHQPFQGRRIEHAILFEDPIVVGQQRRH